MRVRNKELRQRRHRKDKTIKAAIREAKAGASTKPAGEAKPKAPAKKAPAKPKAAKKEA
jgi:hypothetical protein